MVKIEQKYSIYPPKQITSELFVLKTISTRLGSAKEQGYDPCPGQKDDDSEQTDSWPSSYVSIEFDICKKRAAPGNTLSVAV